MSLKGITLVTLGSISYGIPASIFKLASGQGMPIGNVLVGQFWVATAVLAVLWLTSRHAAAAPLSLRQRGQLWLSGLSMACTSLLYFVSLQYISVAVATVMIMQSVWITMIYGWLFKGCRPTTQQMLAVLLVMFGTLLATELLEQRQGVSWLGLGLAFGSACTYAATIMVTGHVVRQAPPLQRALYMSLGAACFSTLIWSAQLDGGQGLEVLPWSALLACFAVVLPLLCFSNGMPLLTPGMAGLLSSIELPSAIICAWLLLGEAISALQLLGILCILLAMALPDLLRRLRRR